MRPAKEIATRCHHRPHEEGVPGSLRNQNLDAERTATYTPGITGAVAQGVVNTNGRSPNGTDHPPAPSRLPLRGLSS